MDQFNKYNPADDWYFNDDIEDYIDDAKHQAAEKGITAKGARKITEYANGAVKDNLNPDMAEVYAEILNAALEGKTSVEIEFIKPEEFNILDQAGFKIFSKDGKKQYIKLEAVQDVYQVIIDWQK